MLETSAFKPRFGERKRRDRVMWCAWPGRVVELSVEASHLQNGPAGSPGVEQAGGAVRRLGPPELYRRGAPSPRQSITLPW